MSNSNDVTLSGVLLDGEVVSDDNGELSLSCPVCREPVVTVEPGDGIGGVLILYTEHVTDCMSDDLSEVRVWMDGAARYHAEVPVDFSVENQEQTARRAKKAIARSKPAGAVCAWSVELCDSELNPGDDWGSVTYRETKRGA